MSPPKAVTWRLEPHTKAKHDILRRYLQAWFAILGRTKDRIVYIDGFSGPGEYADGEEGSPIIALRAVLDHKITFTNEIVFVFIDSDQRRVEHLEQLVANTPKPPNVKVSCWCGKFDEHMTAVLDEIDEQGDHLAPTFAFVDPFGFSGTPFSIIKRVVSHQTCEVLVNFTYESINRWISHPDHEENFDSLFGTPRWRDVANCQTPQERLRFIHGLYRDQLEHDANIQFVRSFEMIDQGNRTEYFLFHGTNHRLGLERMKDAMWRVDPTGGTVFSDATNLDQTVLFGSEPDTGLLERLMKNWGGGNRVRIEALEDFVILKTPFRKVHIRGILKELERAGQLEVHTKRRAGAFPAGTEFTMVL